MQNIEEFETKLYSTDDVCKLLHIGRKFDSFKNLN